ncbi:MAG: FtsX-like permease family protein [Candidatus Limnocylindria bacterium]
MHLAALAWRGLVARRLRTGLTIIGVALGVAVVAGTLLANQAASEAVERAAAQMMGSAELRVRAFDPVGFSPRAVTTLRQIPGVLGAAAVAERRLTVSTLPGPDEQVFSLLLVIGVDAKDEAQIRTYDLEAGAFVEPDSPNDALVNAAWARANGLVLGDQLILTGHREDVQPLRIVGLLGDLGIGALSQGNVLVMHRSTLAAAFEEPPPVTYVDLLLAPGRVEDVQNALDRDLGEPFIVETAADAARQLGRAQAGFAGISFVFGLIALLVGAFLVANTLAMTVTERTREIGLLRAAGATRGQVRGLFLRQGVVIGLIGSILGAALGIGLAALAIGFLHSTRAVLVTGLPLNPLALGLSLLMGVAVTAAAATIPAIAASRVSPLDALRSSRQPGRSLGARLRWIVVLEALVLAIGAVLYPLDRGEFSPAAVVGALAILIAGTGATALLLQPLARVVGRPFEWFFGAEGMLGRANLGRDRARTGLTVGALIVALASVVALGTITESARATADRWVGSILPGGYAIRLGLPVEVDALRTDFEATAGAAAASPIVEFPAVARQGEAPAQEASLAGIDPNVFDATGSLIFVHGDRATAFQALRDGGAVLLPEPFAGEEMGVGSIVWLSLPGEEEQAFAVAGVIAYTLPARSADGAILLSLTDAAERFGATRSSLWTFIPQDGITEGAFQSAVAAKAMSYAGEAITARELASDLGRSIDRLIGLFDVLALLAVIIAALGVLNTLAVGVVERAREIAILRSHGMTIGQVQAMVVSEAAIMGAVGGIAAVATGLLIAWTIVGGSTPRDFGAGLALPWPLLLSVVLIGIGVASLAGLYPARLAARTPISRSIQHFE